MKTPYLPTPLKNYKYMDKVVFSQLYHYHIDKITGEMIDMVLDNINKDKHLKDPTMAGNLVFSAFGGSLVFLKDCYLTS